MRPVALVVVLALAGCAGSDPPAIVGAPPSQPEAKPRCDGKPAGYRVKGRALRGDVDGDGRNDRVTLRVDRRRPPRCRHLLVAGGRTAPVRPLPWPGTNPRLLLLAQIDGRAGAEPVVTLSPANVYNPGAVFTVRDGRLERMRLQGAEPPNLFPLDDEFPADSDCAPEPGTIVVTRGEVADPDTHWDVERTTYRARGLRFEREGTERFQLEVGSEVGGAPFRSCPERVD